MRISPVSPEALVRDWAVIKPMLERVMDRVDCGLTVEHVGDTVLVGDMQMWAVGEYYALAVTEIQKLPRYSVLTVLFLVGEGMYEWLDPLTSLLSAFGKQYECKYMEFYGRPGWDKKAPDVGFKNKFTVMSRRI